MKITRAELALFTRNGIALMLVVTAAGVGAFAGHPVQSKLYDAMIVIMIVGLAVEIPRLWPIYRMSLGQIHATLEEADAKGRPPIFTPLEMVAGFAVVLAGICHALS